jgi:predicted PurR-regulated permease PerM
MNQRIEIDRRTIIFIFSFIAGIWLLILIREILLQAFIALLLMLILNPLVRKLRRFKIPKPLAIFILYVLILGTIALSLASIIPPLVEQTNNFTKNLPDYISNLPISDVIKSQLEKDLLSSVGNMPSQILRFSVSIFSNLLIVLTVIVFAFYLLLTRDNITKELKIYIGEKYALEIDKILDELEIRLGGWARGQLLLMFSVGLLTYIGLAMLGLPYALPLSILAGIFEALPIVGPIIAAIPAVLIGLGTSSIMGLSVAALAFLIQQLENQILVPKIMEKSAGTSPVVILLAIAIGFKLAGIAGVVVSVPVLIIAQVFLEKYFDRSSNSSKN